MIIFSWLYKYGNFPMNSLQLYASNEFNFVGKIVFKCHLIDRSHLTVIGQLEKNIKKKSFYNL